MEKSDEVDIISLQWNFVIKAGFNTSMTRWQKPFWLLTKQLASGGWLYGRCACVCVREHLRACVSERESPSVSVSVCERERAFVWVCVCVVERERKKENLWERNVSECAAVKSRCVKGCVCRQNCVREWNEQGRKQRKIEKIIKANIRRK